MFFAELFNCDDSIRYSRRIGQRLLNHRPRDQEIDIRNDALVIASVLLLHRLEFFQCDIQSTAPFV